METLPLPLPLWRRPEFIQEVKRSVSTPQFERFKKMYHEPFYLLNVSMRGTVTTGTVFRFTVSGSKRDEYVVSVTGTGRTACTCKDAAMTCRHNNMVCKHVIFALYRVLRIETIAFLTTLTLGEADVAAVSRWVLTRGPMDSQEGQGHGQGQGVMSRSEIDAISNGARSQWGQSQSSLSQPSQSQSQSQPNFKTILRPVQPGDECPVCYDTLLPVDGLGQCPSPDLLGCPDCGNAIHAACVIRWLSNAQRPSCVFCRSTIWSKYPRK